MNYYERIQKSIDFMEEHLCEDLSLEECAHQAFMSISGYYRMFFSIVGMTVKEYIRGRRLTSAYIDLQNNTNVLDVAMKYGFNSADGFSRSFQKHFGILPSKIKGTSSHYESLMIERMKIMDNIFENNELTQKYPDIKVIKELKSMKVACFSYYGKCPEDHAYEILKEWFHKNEVSLHETPYRLFGYNNPDPQEGQKEYAYEFCITIPDTLYDTLEDVPADFFGQTYPKVYRKTLTGGKYAVMSVRPHGKDLGEEIMTSWPRLVKWLEESKYMWGTNQYLEEHLGFSPEDDHIGGVDLYISIAEDKQKLITQVVRQTKVDETLVVFREEGANFNEINYRSWNRAIAWAQSVGLTSSQCTIYQYNQGYNKPKILFNVVMIQVPKSFLVPPSKNNEYVIETLKGEFAVLPSSWGEAEGLAWETIRKWCQKNKITPSKKQWLEECEHKNWKPTGKIKCLYPLD